MNVLSKTLMENEHYGEFPLEELLLLKAPPAPIDFMDFWRKAYERTRNLDTRPSLSDTKTDKAHWKILDLQFYSTNSTEIKGWLLVPKQGLPKRAFIVGHGYGGRSGPDFHLPFPDAAIFFPCFRGISRSRAKGISENPNWHVLHDIDKKDQYILRGCVEDLWLSVSTMEYLFPYLAGKIAYMGISFGGGIGALALSQETRIARAHLNVPTFGHHRARLRFRTYGSGMAVQNFYKKEPRKALNTLRYYDAASAAEHISIPMHFALALRDSVVTPPGQFAIHNHCSGDKKLYVLKAGHAEYKEKQQQELELLNEITEFFSVL